MIKMLKTFLGFFGTMFVSFLERNTPVKFSGDAPEDTYNYVKISDTLATSGQPTEKQFYSIRDAGYQTVINLAPNSFFENSLKTEESLLAELGLDYIHLPVAFDNPTDVDFEQFVAAMQEALQPRNDSATQPQVPQKVWVHCAANARVSAFVYRYRCAVLGESEAVARVDLAKIWAPYGVWKKFTGKRSEGIQ